MMIQLKYPSVTINSIIRFIISMSKFLISVVLLSNFFWISETKAQIATIRPITFPVIGRVTYWDDFGAPRDGGTRSHKGNDLMGRKMLPLVSAVDGTVVNVDFPEESWGYSVTIRDDEGYTYHYIHINNDIPGTDNGQGGAMNAYAVDMKVGNRVMAGQLIGWMGDSGNAEPTQAHLHFEIRLNGEPFSPYASLQAARKITAPVDYPQLAIEALPYGGFRGGANVAVGNLDADLQSEVVTAASTGGGPHLQVFDGETKTPKWGFFAYAQGFRGGVDVATGDMDGDGVDEIITSPISGGGPHIKVFKADGSLISEFLAYAPGFRGGVKVAASDLNNDGMAEIVTGPGKGGGPHVKVFDYLGNKISEFFAYENFNGGIDVAVSKAGRIITAPGTGGGPHLKIFDLSGNVISEFFAYDQAHRGGVRVSAGANEIVTAPLMGGPDIRKYDLNGILLGSDTAFEEWWHGSWDVGINNDTVFMSTGPNSDRRTSVREVDFEPEQRFRFRDNGDEDDIGQPL